MNPPATSTAFDAFVSYSHALDEPVAEGLVSGLHRFARPWYRARALHVFRDKSCLAANPLWESIQNALEGSRMLVLLASPEAAGSPWVAREIAYWCDHRGADTLLIALTAGEIVWDSSAGDFDWSRTTALPRTLERRLTSEPLYVDLRWARDVGSAARHDGRFDDAVATLAARLHGRPKDELVGEDVRHRRNAVRLARAVVAVIVLLGLAAATGAVIAVQERNTAQQQRQVAVSRQLAADAVAAYPTRVDRAMLLAIEAMRTAPTVEARGALIQVLGNTMGVERVLSGHHSAITAMRFRPDGRALATGDADGTLLLWDLDVSRKTPQTLVGHHAAISAIAFTSDELLTTDRDGTVIRWTAFGQQLDSTNFAGRPLAFDSGGDLIAVADTADTVVVVDVQSGTRLTPSIPARAATPNSVAFSADGRVLAAVDGRTVALVSVETGTASVSPLTADAGANFVSVAFSSDDGRVIAGDLDGGVCTWRANGSPVACAAAHSRESEALGSGVGDVTASGGGDKTVALIDNTTGSVLSVVYGHGAGVGSIAFRPDGQQYAAGDADGVVTVSDLNSAGLSQPVVDLSVSPDPTWTPTYLASLPVAAAREGREFAAAMPDGTEVWMNTALWGSLTAGAWQRGVDLPVHVDAPGSALAMSADGRMVVSASSDDGVMRWDTTTGRAIGSPLLGPSASSRMYGLTFTPDGRTLIGVEGDTEGPGPILVHLWASATGTELAQLTIDGSVDFSTIAADATDEIAAHAAGRKVVLWDLKAHEQRHIIDVGGSVQDLALSPDGRIVAVVANRRVLMFETATGAPVGELADLGDDIYSLAFSADGSTLAAGGWGTIALWDVKTRRLLSSSLYASDSVVRAVVLSFDGSAVLAATDTYLAAFDVDVDALIHRACTIANRSLTPGEWDQYLPGTPWRDTCPATSADREP